MKINEKLKLQISLPRNERDDHKVELINRATRILLDALMSRKLQNTLNLKIHLRKTVLKGTTVGAFVCILNGCKKQKEHKIVLDWDRGSRQLLTTLAHELIHVHQRVTGKLQWRVWKSDKQLHARWDGQEIGLVDAIDYRERPWEIEAYAKQDDLYQLVRHINSDLYYEHEVRLQNALKRA
eukprot:GHVU01228499.1.p1 GENE.GHVU01228499.1~~GHVU01228499.1.p1  ORF type:complete len:181 (+),score=7.01 GHVU01228499.1:1196-1738(+)